MKLGNCQSKWRRGGLVSAILSANFAVNLVCQFTTHSGHFPATALRSRALLLLKKGCQNVNGDAVSQYVILARTSQRRVAVMRDSSSSR